MTTSSLQPTRGGAPNVAEILATEEGQHLVRWFESLFREVQSPDTPALVLLHHMLPGKRMGDRLGTSPLMQYTPADIPTMVCLIFQKAADHLRNYGGSKREQYGLFCCYLKTPAQSETCTYFYQAKPGGQDLSSGLAESEDTRLEGIVRLVMEDNRDLRAQFHDRNRELAAIALILRENNQDVATEMKELRRESREQWTALRTAEDGRATRELAQKRQEATIVRDDKLLSMGQTLLSGLMRFVEFKMAGPDAAGATTAESQLLSIARTLKPELIKDVTEGRPVHFTRRQALALALWIEDTVALSPSNPAEEQMVRLAQLFTRAHIEDLVAGRPVDLTTEHRMGIALWFQQMIAARRDLDARGGTRAAPAAAAPSAPGGNGTAQTVDAKTAADEAATELARLQSAAAARGSGGSA